MENQLTNACKNKRTAALINLSNSKKEVFYKESIGKTGKVLIENKIEEKYMSGFTENYVRIRLPYNPHSINKIIKVKILNIDENENICNAEMVKE
jgi:threonylcarbamoyladenosine tRNA methylthiotransferase MtaB